jgi:hypothetical protein
MLGRIVSGGETGVDRAALDFAIAMGIDYGGWCPRGGWAEDLPRPPGVLSLYPRLAETPGRDPEQRTRWNVRDSDATLIIIRAGAVSPGTDRALSVAREFGRPHLVVNSDQPVSAIDELLGAFDGEVFLNVAGPRESEAPGIYDQAGEFLERWLAVQAARGSGGISTT